MFTFNRMYLFLGQARLVYNKSVQMIEVDVPNLDVVLGTYNVSSQTIPFSSTNATVFYSTFDVHTDSSYTDFFFQKPTESLATVLAEMDFQVIQKMMAVVIGSLILLVILVASLVKGYRLLVSSFRGS